MYLPLVMKLYSIYAFTDLELVTMNKVYSGTTLYQIEDTSINRTLLSVPKHLNCVYSTNPGIRTPHYLRHLN